MLSCGQVMIEGKKKKKKKEEKYTHSKKEVTSWVTRQRFSKVEVVGGHNQVVWVWGFVGLGFFRGFFWT